MIDKLEAGRTYRLIDKEGYFATNRNNKGIYDRNFVNDCILITNVVAYRGYCGNSYFIISNEEYKFFELLQEPCDTLTRCQELAAEYNDSRFTVEYKQQVLESLIQLLTTGETK